MAEQEPGAPLPSAVGTITFNPAASTKIFLNQKLMVTADVVMQSGNPIPSGASIKLTGTGLKIDPNDGNTQPVIITSADKLKGVATFYVEVISSSSVTVKGQTENWSNAPAAPSPVTFNNISTDNVGFNSTGPTNIYLPLAPDNSQLPTADAYTTVVTATVTDPSNSNAGVPNYVVEWSQKDSDIGLFNGKIRAFLDKTDTNALQPGDPALGGSHSSGFYVRATTNDQGIATLYMVAKQTLDGDAPATVGASLLVTPTSLNDTFGGGEFIVADLNGKDIDDPATPDGLDVNSVLQYGKISGSNVPVNIPQYPGADDEDVIYAFINQKFQSRITWVDAKTQDWNSSFTKADAYNDQPPHANAENQLQYVVATKDGGALTARPFGFKGAGPLQTTPDPGPLDAPWVMGTGKVINYGLVQGTNLVVAVPLPYSGSVAAQHGDAVAVTAYLNGYPQNSDIANPTTTIHGSNPSISSNDQTNGYALVSLDASKFQNWGPMQDSPYTKATCDFVYTVTRSGLNPAPKSRIFRCTVNTFGR